MSSPAAEPVVLEAAARERTAWLDLARVVAILCVVVVHVTMVAVNGNRTDEGTAAWWVANALNSTSRWCVPVFLMVSGALLLDPRRVERPRDFYRKRLGKVGIPIVVWTVVYLLFRRFYLGSDLTPVDAVRDVASGTPFLQLYFLYVLLGLYLLTPFLRIVLRETTRRMQLGFAAVLLGLGAVDQVAAELLGAGDPTAATRFLPFAGFFVLGWVLRDVVLSRRLVRWSAVAFVGSVLVTIALVGLTATLFRWGSPGRYLYGFLSPPVIVMSVAAFVLLRVAGRRLRGRGARVAASLSALTFGVYLVHPLVLYPLARHVPLPQDLPGFLAVFALQLVATTAGSLLLTVVLRRIPGVRQSL